MIEEGGYAPKNKIERAHLTSLCQKFIRELRDVEGKRLVYFVAKRHSVNNVAEYVTVRTCDDEKELLYIKHKMYTNVAGLENSISNINVHLAALNAMLDCFDLAIKKESEGLNERKW